MNVHGAVWRFTMSKPVKNPITADHLSKVMSGKCITLDFPNSGKRRIRLLRRNDGMIQVALSGAGPVILGASIAVEPSLPAVNGAAEVYLNSLFT